jgi:hypothetical protein
MPPSGRARAEQRWRGERLLGRVGLVVEGSSPACRALPTGGMVLSHGAPCILHPPSGSQPGSRPCRAASFMRARESSLQIASRPHNRAPSSGGASAIDKPGTAATERRPPLRRSDRAHLDRCRVVALFRSAPRGQAGKLRVEDGSRTRARRRRTAMDRFKAALAGTVAAWPLVPGARRTHEVAK